MDIKLNPCEQKMAQYLARARYNNARNRGVENKKMGGQSDEATDLEGIGAEIAYCKAMNVYPDTETNLQADELPPEDAVTKQGCRVDVKCTKYRSGHLLAVLGKKNKKQPDVYVLVIGEFPVYRIVGQMSATELLQEKRIGNLGHGNGYMASQDELSPVVPDNEFGGMF